MQSNRESLTAQQQEQLLIAIKELQQNWGVSSILEEFKRMYWLSQSNEWYDHAPSRVDGVNAFQHLHDFLSKADMILEEKKECCLLNV